MLRLFALALLLANGLYFAWSNDLLLAYGFGQAQKSEPQRLLQQISPDAVRLIDRKEFKQIEEQIRIDKAPKECYQAGPFDAAQSATLRQTLGEVLPDNAWIMEEVHVDPRWIVYLGKYASAEMLAKKRAEIAALNLKPDHLDNPALEPGISLGGFDTKADADAQLARFSARGLHTARVVQERAEGSAYELKLPAIGAALKPKLVDVRAALGSKTLHVCNE